MFGFKWLVGAVAVSTVSAINFARVDSLIRAGVLKRDDLSPGSPLYNCHDNCGEAILESKNCDSVCNDSIFLTDYENCLQCAGPDNENIWQYYGPSLTTYASDCGLSTLPLNGTQADVVAAVASSNSTASCNATSATASSSDSSASSSATSSSTSATSSASASSAAIAIPADAAACAALLVGAVGMHVLGW